MQYIHNHNTRRLTKKARQSQSTPDSRRRIPRIFVFRFGIFKFDLKTLCVYSRYFFHSSSHHSRSFSLSYSLPRSLSLSLSLSLPHIHMLFQCVVGYSLSLSLSFSYTHAVQVRCRQMNSHTWITVWLPASLSLSLSLSLSVRSVCLYLSFRVCTWLFIYGRAHRDPDFLSVVIPRTLSRM